MKFLEKLQNLPEGKRKIILWSVAIILSLFLLSFYIKNSQQKLRNFHLEEIKLPSFQEEFKTLPNEIPEGFKQIEEKLKETPQLTPTPT
jgi:type III secretory pathway component EscR